MNDDEAELPEESVEDLYENAPCGYLSTRPDGTIAKINLTLLNWLGYRRDDVVNQLRFIDLLTLPGRVFHETHYAPLLYMQGSANEIALELVGKHGRALPVLLSSIHKLREDGSVAFTRTTVFNAEQRRSYERELLLERRKAEQAAKARACFVAAASGELRNHLHSIAALAELFVQGQTGAQHAHYTGLLGASSSRLVNLVGDVLDYSRQEAGRLALDERPFHVRELIQGVVFNLRSWAEIKGLTVRTEIDSRVPNSVLGDAIKLTQVLTNLTGNALKFTEHGMVALSVRVRELGPGQVRLVFSVSDTGMGMSTEQCDALGAELERTSQGGAAPRAGQGLGLVISQRLLDMYGARLRISSVPARGSIFSFDLSLAVAPLQTAPGDSTTWPPKEGRALRGLRVLVAEDAAVDALLLTHLLERWGVEVELVNSGNKAVERVKVQDYDLVLMGLHLPGLDGLDAARAIRALREAAADGVPIIALADQVEPGQRDRLQGAGFTDCLGKPFESDSLLRSVSMHASIHRAMKLRSPSIPAPPKLPS